MGLTLSKTRSGVMGDLRYWIGTATFDSAYAQGGESLTAANFGFSTVYTADAKGADGVIEAQYDITNSKLKLFGSVLGIDSGVTATINDSDTAASDGVAVYLHIDNNPGVEGMAVGHLEFVSPTDADGTAVVGAAATDWSLRIKDSDAAATGGYVVRAQAAGAGLRADLDLDPAVAGVYIPLAGVGDADTSALDSHFGAAIYVADSDTATDPQLYFDEDGANAYERLEAVVVDNADETVKIYIPYPGYELPTGTDASEAVINVFAVGTP